MFQESLCEIRAEQKSLYRTLDVLNFVGNEKKKKNWYHSEETKHFHLQMTFRSDKFLRKKKRRALFYPLPPSAYLWRLSQSRADSLDNADQGIRESEL